MRPTTDFGVLSPYLWRYRVLMEFSLKTRVLIGYFEVTWHIFIIHLKYFAVSDWLKSLFISSQAFIQYPSLLSVFHSFFFNNFERFLAHYVRWEYRLVADPGEGPRGPAPPLFLDQTEARRAEKLFWGDRPSPLSKRLDDRHPQPPSQGLDPALQIMTIMNLSKDVFERRTSTGSGLFSFLDSGFAHLLGQLVSIIVKTLRNTNLGASRCFKMKKTSLPVDVRRSKTPLLKLPNDVMAAQFVFLLLASVI